MGFNHDLNDSTMAQICNSFAHFTTAQLSWHMQKYDVIGSLFFHVIKKL